MFKSACECTNLIYINSKLNVIEKSIAKIVAGNFKIVNLTTSFVI